jgi:DNA replication protein DnaC
LEGVDDAFLTGCDLLIIDDLGTEYINSFVGSALFQLLNARISLRRGTVISTNLSPLEIGRIYSDRISSRIMEHFILIRVFGEDIRVRKRIRGASV